MRVFRIQPLLIVLLATAPAAAGAVCLPELDWNATYNGVDSGADAAQAVAAGADGSVVAVGYELRSGLDQGQNWLIRKYSSAGALLWSQDYNGSADGDDRAHGVAVDTDGNIIVVGMVTRTDLVQGTNWLVRKYDSDGNWLWDATYNSPANTDDCALAVAVDSSKNVIVAGYETRNDIYQEENWVIRKYDAAGNLLWHKSYNGPASRTDKAYGVAVDLGDNIVVVGSEYRMSTRDDWRIRKFSAAGAALWNVVYDGPASDGDVPFGVDVAVTGTIYVAGYNTSSGTGEDWHIRAYSASGADVWNATHNNPSNSNDRAYALAVDNYGNVLAVGTEGAGGDWLVRRYSANGAYQCSVGYAGPGAGADAARGIAVDANNFLAVAGDETGVSPEGLNWHLRRYLQPTAC